LASACNASAENVICFSESYFKRIKELLTMIDAFRSNPDITTRLATKSLRDRFMSAEAGHIVVVDDDSTLRQMVIRYLEDHDVPTRAASSRDELRRHLEGAEPSLIILDLRLGQDDGLDLLREIRSYSDVPVIITTGHRPDEIDRIVGLELGADDYIIKPFSLRELLARVRAVLRRQEMGRAARARDPERGGYRFNGWTLERRGRKLLDADNCPVALSKGEYALLLAFLEAPQRPLTREHLLQATRVHEDIFDRSIDVQVLRLRRKLETDPSAPRIIQTERGVGYVFALPVEPF
jgi:two-component system OmpR family response regulator